MPAGGHRVLALEAEDGSAALFRTGLLRAQSRLRRASADRRETGCLPHNGAALAEPVARSRTPGPMVRRWAASQGAAAETPARRGEAVQELQEALAPSATPRPQQYDRRTIPAPVWIYWPPAPCAEGFDRGSPG